ncbi:peptidase domain-containing ABC transporter [Steroidobacter flavus]|uniref:Peptidase domain-containing ABC transporter n=1 Tax=Steroidobacter flavus TaxID=1842136 RepID=A0ABV8SP33_9GAMM
MSRHRVPYIPQLDALECGASCIAMVLAYHGHHAPLPEVREACGVSRDGVSLQAMLEAARAYGLTATAYSVSLEQLELLPLPAVLHWDFNHFVVLEKWRRGGGAVIVDPARGRLNVSKRVLEQSFTGAVLALDVTPDLQPRRRKTPHLGRYRALVRDNAGAIGIVLGCSALLELLVLTLPIGQQLLVDRALVGKDVPLLMQLAAAFFLATVVQGAVTLGRGYVIGNLHVVLDLRLLGDFMRHAVRLPIGFFMQRAPGDLLQRLEGNSMLRSLLGTEIVASLLDSLLVIGLAALMIAYHWMLGLLVIAMGGVRVLFQLYMREVNRRAAAAELTALSGTGAALVASLDSIETLRATSAESFALRRWNDRVVRRACALLPRLDLENTGAQSTVAINSLALALVCLVGGREVLAGQMSIGVFSAFLTLQALFLAPVGSLMQNLHRLQLASSHLSRLDDVLEAEPEGSGHYVPSDLRGEIKLEQVSFRYSAQAQPSLVDIDVHVQPGELIALVGPSGSGKSTLARILLGLLSPSQGTVMFDGRDLREFDIDALRRRMGVVLQEVELLSDTVHANISCNDPTISIEAVRSAARLACIDHVIEALPRGYDTPLGGNDAQLSGGERQRLCIARAIAHRPAILLLDEATSALDAETERRIHEHLRELRCTRIVIAHRLQTVRDADRVLVMEQGRIVKQGTFASLQAEQGLFRDLVRSAELQDA